MLRQGTLPSVAYAFNTSGSIVNVGHSWGSQLTYGLSSLHPNVTDAVVLTGFSTNGSFANGLTASTNSEIASLNQPLRFGSGSVSAQNQSRTLSSLTSILASSAFDLTPSQQADLLRSTTLWDIVSGLPSTPSFPSSPQNLSSGYLTWASSFGNQYNFLHPPGIDPMILPYSESTKQPYTMGELLTTGNISPASPIAAFTGPVLIINGVEDSIFCGGDCLSSITGQPNGTTILNEARKNSQGRGLSRTSR
jgi:pimeloyl-ACP methyl ester carboxylesterase